MDADEKGRGVEVEGMRREVVTMPKFESHLEQSVVMRGAVRASSAGPSRIVSQPQQVSPRKKRALRALSFNPCRAGLLPAVFCVPRVIRVMTFADPCQPSVPERRAGRRPMPDNIEAHTETKTEADCSNCTLRPHDTHNNVDTNTQRHDRR